MPNPPHRIELSSGLNISRLICGLWQVADMEKGGSTLDRERAADALAAYVEAGFDTFDMADHYGSAELIVGRLLATYPEGARRPLALTKWCPSPGSMTAEIVDRGVRERLERLGLDRLDLMQFHWWSYEHPGWLDALHEMNRLRQEGLIGALGLTNFDAAHFALALAEGVPVVANQVSFSLIDRRAAGPLSALCDRANVKLIAYGALCGGFISERWLRKPEPQAPADWSRAKYKRFIDAAGGWRAFQTVLSAAGEIARKHGVSIANVATRWVLDRRAVAAVIIGARIGESEHRADNAAVFDLTLDAEDNDRLEAAFRATTPIPGDCGDEYRRPPYLTASGDLSHHLDGQESVYKAAPQPTHADRLRVSSGSIWEPVAGYSRAVRVKDRICVSGTTATHGADRCVAPGDAGAQATYILDKIASSLAALGGRMEDVIRTRVYLRDASQWEPVARAHGRAFADVLPANTLIQAGNLIGDYEVEIEAEAVTPDLALAESRRGPADRTKGGAMSDERRRSPQFERGLATRRKVLGDEHVERSLQQADDFSWPFQQIVTEWVWDEIWNRPGLDRRSRSLLNLGMLAALNRPQELKIHIRGAINNGLSKDEIREAFLQVGGYCGMPAALDGFRAALEVFKEMGLA